MQLRALVSVLQQLSLYRNVDGENWGACLQCVLKFRASKTSPRLVFQ